MHKPPEDAKRSPRGSLGLVVWLIVVIAGQSASAQASGGNVEPAAFTSLRTPGVPVQAAPQTRLGSPSHAAALAYLDAGDKARAAGLPECVDLYYRAAVIAYASLARQAPPARDRLAPETLSTYNRALGRCLEAGTIFGRLDPRSHLTIHDRSGSRAVPLSHQGFTWPRESFGRVIDARALRRSREIRRPHQRAGVGAPVVVLSPEVDARGDFLIRNRPFNATAILHPDLDAWFGAAGGRPPADVLILADPIRVPLVSFLGTTARTSADLDAQLNFAEFQAGGSRYNVLALLRPYEALPFADLYMLEPYQPGKIPVVFVHGLASSPFAWGDIIGDLRSTPGFLDRFQIWVFTYPTGMGFLRNAAILRQSLHEIVARHDPQGLDPALRDIVLVGHSMGGLLSKLQACSSGMHLWNLAFLVPPDQVAMPPRYRDLVFAQVFFEPHPNVGRVVLAATPHRGASLARRLIGRLSSRLIREPDDVQVIVGEIKSANPGAVSPILRRLPNSIDLLESDHPLLIAMLRLPRDPDVPFHSIIGIRRNNVFTGEIHDGVVAVRSARITGVASEVFLDETHNTINHAPATTEEIRRILAEHLAAHGITRTADAIEAPRR